MAEGTNPTRTAYLWASHPDDGTVRTRLTITQTQAQNTTNATFATTNATTLSYMTTEPCILHGEQILMADGTSKNVQDIVVGDQVKAISIDGLGLEEDSWRTWFTHGDEFNESNATTEITTVTVGNWGVYYELMYNTGGEAKSLQVTGEHPVLSKRNNQVAFTAAGDLLVTDEVYYFPTNTWVELTQIDRIENNTLPTYSLGAEDADNYVAGGIIVHNIEELEKRT